MAMKQQTLAMAADQSSYEHCRKPTGRDEFLVTMQAIVPWTALCAVIEPHYPKTDNGRSPIGLERILRIHFIHVWTRVLQCHKGVFWILFAPLYEFLECLCRVIGPDRERKGSQNCSTTLK